MYEKRTVSFQFMIPRRIIRCALRSERYGILKQIAQNRLLNLTKKFQKNSSTIPAYQHVLYASKMVAVKPAY